MSKMAVIIFYLCWWRNCVWNVCWFFFFFSVTFGAWWCRYWSLMCNLQSIWTLWRSMSTTQITAYQPKICVRHIPHSYHLPSNSCILPTLPKRVPRTSLSTNVNASRHQQCVPVSKYQQSMPVCLFGGKGKTGGENGVRVLVIFKFIGAHYWTMLRLNFQVGRKIYPSCW